MPTRIMTSSGLLLASLLVTCLPSRADWVMSATPGIVRPAPDQLQTQPQNPPSITWARHRTYPAQYVVEIQRKGGTTTSYTVSRNFILLAQPLEAGQYAWRVRPLSSVIEWSDWRGFMIDATSKQFVVPENNNIGTAILAHPRPRQLATNFQLASNWSAAMRADRGGALAKLTTEVNTRMISLAPVSNANFPPLSSTAGAAAISAQYVLVSNTMGSVIRQMEAAALMYRLTLDKKYLQEAIARGDQIASLDPEGATSFTAQDQVARMMSLVLAKGADLLWNELDTPRRKVWMDMAILRARPIYDNLAVGNGRLDQTPLDSHGIEALGYLSLISVLALGESPEAKVWLDFAVRSYAHLIHVWSGAEGGYSNGTAYAQYTIDMQMQVWQPLAQATGINLFEKPWAAGFASFFMQFTPPGTPSHVFGDVHEGVPDQALMKAFISRQKTPAAAWFVNNTVGEENPITLLQAPYPLPVATVTAPAPPPNAMLFPSIGWVAMHSSMADRARTSVFFKSSPYGSYNHSHGDQNSIVINSGGRKLLTEAGYQDYFASPQAMSWYRTTKAHNAVTVDGGLGQPVAGTLELLDRKGRITAFHTSPTLDYAEGDALPAYNGLLTTALRKVWYLRGQDMVVVLDTLASATPRIFEWNLHAAAPITFTTANAAKIVNVDRSLCLQSLSTDGTALAKRLSPPPKVGTIEDHAAFVKPAAALKGEFLVVLDVGCKGIKSQLTKTSTGRQLTVGTQSIVLP